MRGPALFPQKAPLESHPAFRASHYDALKQAVATQLSAKFVDLPSHPAALDARANRFDLPQSSLWFCSYGIPIAIEFPEPDHVRLQFHHAGVGATWIGNDLVPVTPDQACVTSTAAEFDLGEGYEQIVWRISKDILRKKLAELTAEPLRGELDFNNTLDLRTAPARVLTHILSCTINAAESMSVESGKVVLGELEQALISTFLAVSEHRYRNRLEGRVPAAAPWQVRRAEAYIAANWDKPLEIETLAEVTGASVRSIFRAFKQSRGYTPFEFAKRIRLNHARRMLEDGEPGGSVTSICFACGFSDLGRFSKDFAQAFGERPSDVLKRHKGALAAMHRPPALECQSRGQFRSDRSSELCERGELAHPLVMHALDRRHRDAGIAQAIQPRGVMRRRRGATILQDGNPVASGGETERRMRDTDIGFQADQDKLASSARGYRGPDVGLVSKAEHHLVEDRLAGGQQRRQFRHQRTILGDVLGGGDDRNLQRAGDPHQPGDARHQRRALIERQLRQEILLDVDDQQAGAVAVEESAVPHLEPSALSPEPD